MRTSSASQSRKSSLSPSPSLANYLTFFLSPLRPPLGIAHSPFPSPINYGEREKRDSRESRRRRPFPFCISLFWKCTFPIDDELSHSHLSSVTPLLLRSLTFCRVRSICLDFPSTPSATLPFVSTLTRARGRWAEFCRKGEDSGWDYGRRGGSKGERGREGERTRGI